jgi:hypothetical protein
MIKRVLGLEEQADRDGAHITVMETQAVTDRNTIDALTAQSVVNRDEVGALTAQADIDHHLIADLESQGVIDRDVIANLELALKSARKIGAAVGIIMAAHKVNEEQAFHALRIASQHSHRKLRDVADDVLVTGLSPEAG